ncbi:MAG: LysR family transcriptional regulator [Pseudomonadota bacterium]
MVRKSQWLRSNRAECPKNRKRKSTKSSGFTQAAAKLKIFSHSALSYSIKRLEAKYGVGLETRTTRSVAPTKAGDRLFASLRPALQEIGSGITSLTEMRDRPTGTIRIMGTLLWPTIEGLMAKYPDIQVVLNVESSLTDLRRSGAMLASAFGGTPSLAWLSRDHGQAQVIPDCPVDLRWRTVGFFYLTRSIERVRFGGLNDQAFT